MLRANRLLGGLAALALACPVPATAQATAIVRQAPRLEIGAYVREASHRFGMPESWIYAVIRIESAGRTRAVSSAGAMGLMQLMPGTWARQRARFSLGSDPFDPRDNILAGTSYLREMYDRYGEQGFLAAYNAGPGRYEQWLAGRRSLPLETRKYLARIAPLLQSGHIFVASAEGASGASFPTQTELPDSGPAPREPGGTGHPANPFSRSEQPAHDLFVPISTATAQ